MTLRDFKGSAPWFSAIVPCFNAERTIDATLASLVAQTYANWEALLVDDGSTDGTAERLAAWARKDSRIRVVRIANSGPSVARNHAAMSLARGEYLAFLDSDDIWEPRKLAHVAAMLRERPEVTATYGRIAFFRGDIATARTQSKILPHALTISDLLRENAVCTMSNLVVQTEFFCESGGFDPSIVFGEDLQWLVRAVAQGAIIDGMDELMVYYRASDAGLSVNLERMHAGWRGAARAAEACGVDLDDVDLHAAEAVHLRYLARRALRVQAPRGAALRLACRALAISPRGFFSDFRRGGMTFLAACLEPLLPRAWLRRAQAL